MHDDQFLALLAVLIAGHEGMEPGRAVDRAHDFIQIAHGKLNGERSSKPLDEPLHLSLEPEPAA
jgi:hypothetical protein